MMWTLKPRRITLVADVARAVLPPIACQTVKIGNATPDDLKVYEDQTDETTYFVVAAGYEKEITLPQSRFEPNVTAFYLKAAQAGQAVLIWL